MPKNLGTKLNNNSETVAYKRRFLKRKDLAWKSRRTFMYFPSYFKIAAFIYNNLIERGQETLQTSYVEFKAFVDTYPVKNDNQAFEIVV